MPILRSSGGILWGLSAPVKCPVPRRVAARRSFASHNGVAWGGPSSRNFDDRAGGRCPAPARLAIETLSCQDTFAVPLNLHYLGCCLGLQSFIHSSR